jgi:hypothetical protein
MNSEFLYIGLFPLPTTQFASVMHCDSTSGPLVSRWDQESLSWLMHQCSSNVIRTACCLRPLLNSLHIPRFKLDWDKAR